MSILIETIFHEDEDRNKFYNEMIHEFSTQIYYHLNISSVHCDAEVYAKLSRCYFTLNSIYKRHKIKSGHKTKFTKIAALTFISVFLLRPYHGDKRLFEAQILKANFELGLYLAESILNFHLEDKLSRDQMERLYDSVVTLDVQFMKLFLAQDTNTGYELTLNEIGKIGMIITLFELLSK